MADVIRMIKCSSCNRTKREGLFYKNKIATKAGLYVRCISCDKKYQRAYYAQKKAEITPLPKVEDGMPQKWGIKRNEERQILKLTLDRLWNEFQNTSPLDPKFQGLIYQINDIEAKIL
jgi:hypothetical protein